MRTHLRTKLLDVLLSAAVLGVSGIGGAQNAVVDATVPVAASQIVLVSDTDFGRGRLPALDVSPYNMVRLNIVVESCDPCSNITVRVEGHGKDVDYYVLDTFNISNSSSNKGSATRVYDIPGLSVNVAIANLRTGSRNWVRVEMLGHSN